MTVLEVRSVRKAFGDHVVLDGIDLELAQHEVVVLIGASGSGKSTLLRTINLIERVDDGQILLNGDDLTDPTIDPDAARARIGVVFQHFNLFPHLRVIDNVTLAARKVHGMPKTEAYARGTELLEQLGLGAKAREFPDRLSGGQQQRVAIVRAVMTNPELLLLDEITSALDPQLVGEVLDLVRVLRDRGSTMLMATHEMSFAREVADRIVFMRADASSSRARPRRSSTTRSAPRRSRSSSASAAAGPCSPAPPRRRALSRHPRVEGPEPAPPRAWRVLEPVEGSGPRP